MRKMEITSPSTCLCAQVRGDSEISASTNSKSKKKVKNRRPGANNMNLLHPLNLLLHIIPLCGQLNLIGLLCLNQSTAAAFEYNSQQAAAANGTTAAAATTTGKPPNYLETSRQITNILDRFMNLGYDKRVRPNYGGPPVEVNVTMRILSISSVSEVMMDFTADFYFRQTWHDPRLAFRKLDNIKTLYVGAEVSKKIWLPDTFFGNEKLAYFHEATTPNVFLRIDHSGEVYRSIRLTVTSSCPMNLQYFPMDRQRCTIEAESYGYNVKDIIYRWARSTAVERDKEISLPQFDIVRTVQKYRLEELSSGTYSRLIAEIHFARRMGYYLIQIYIPSSLIVVISWVSFWLHRNASPARVQLGVTTVLTMTTLMSSTNAALPKISYVKSIDIFLGTCFVMVFAALLEYATVGYLGKRIAMRKAQIQHAQSQAQAKLFAQLQAQGAQGDPVPLTFSANSSPLIGSAGLDALATAAQHNHTNLDHHHQAPMFPQNLLSAISVLQAPPTTATLSPSAPSSIVQHFNQQQQLAAGHLINNDHHHHHHHQHQPDCSNNRAPCSAASGLHSTDHLAPPHAACAGASNCPRCLYPSPALHNHQPNCDRHAPTAAAHHHHHNHEVPTTANKASVELPPLPPPRRQIKTCPCSSLISNSGDASSQTLPISSKRITFQGGDCEHQQHRRHYFNDCSTCNLHSPQTNAFSTNFNNNNTTSYIHNAEHPNCCNQQQQQQQQSGSKGAQVAAAAAAATFVNLHRKNKGLPPSTNPNFAQFSSPSYDRTLETIFGVRPSDIDKYSRVVFPVCFVCFQLMYWIVYLHISAFLDPESQQQQQQQQQQPTS